MTAVTARRDGIPGAPPRCDTCGQPLHWNAPRCTCGHPVSAHYQTNGGTITYCCNGGPAGNCGCARYEHATDGYYGPLEVAP